MKLGAAHPSTTREENKTKTKDMSHTTIISEDIEEVLEVNLKEGNKKPPLLLSDPGAGKDYQVSKFCASQGMHLIDYRVTQKTPQDVRGFPMPNRETRKMEYMIDEDFDFIDEKPNCLFVNEMLNGSSRHSLRSCKLCWTDALVSSSFGKTPSLVLHPTVCQTRRGSNV